MEKIIMEENGPRKLNLGFSLLLIRIKRFYYSSKLKQVVIEINWKELMKNSCLIIPYSYVNERDYNNLCW